MQYGSAEHARVYGLGRAPIEGINGHVKDSAYEDLHQKAKRRIRGIAAQSLFTAVSLVAMNLRKIRVWREIRAGERPMPWKGDRNRTAGADEPIIPDGDEIDEDGLPVDSNAPPDG